MNNLFGKSCVGIFILVAVFCSYPLIVHGAPPASWDTSYRTAAMTEGEANDYVIVWKGEHKNHCVGIVKYKTKAVNDQGSAISEDWAFGYYATRKAGTVNNCDDIGTPQRTGLIFLHGNFGRGKFDEAISKAIMLEIPAEDRYPFVFSISGSGQGPKCDSQECETCAGDPECITYFGDNAGICREECCCFSCSLDTECTAEFGTDWKCGQGCI